MNGAVHGDRDDDREDAREECVERAASFDDRSGPRRTTRAARTRTRRTGLSASTKKRSASALTTAGDCSWKPQPSCAPPGAQREQRARERDERQHDAGRDTRPLRAASSPAVVRCASAKPSTFSVSTGKTHGIRLSSKPPKSASASATSSDVGARSCGSGVGRDRTPDGAEAPSYCVSARAPRCALHPCPARTRGRPSPAARRTNR